MNLEEGTRIEYHPDINYPGYTFNKFSREEREMLESDRENGTMTPVLGRGNGGYGGRGRGGSRGYGDRSNSGYISNKKKIQQLEQENYELRSQAIPGQVDTQRSAINQVTTIGGLVMGDRADQVRQQTGGHRDSRGWS